MIINSQFKPLSWLTNKHGQTLYRTLTMRSKVSIDSIERLELPDGDFIDLFWSQKGISPDAPLIILLYGLGGSINSPYLPGLFKKFNQLGYRVVLMNFRGASGEPNRLPRSYHAGDTADLGYLLQVLQQREPQTLKAALGISLGGNILLKWLGENGAKSLLHAAIAVSVPFELQTVVQEINKGFSKIYQAYLLYGLRYAFLQKFELVNQQLSLSKQTMFSIKTLYEFDKQITAPLHGFASVDDYYRLSSARQYLKSITTPTLIIHALDDPFMTPAVIPHQGELAPDVLFELSQHGGHVGFITGQIFKHACWLEQRSSLFFNEQIPAKT
jgi:predicted alpha/beta-fold hydrolase